MTTQPHILVIDDEAQILRALRTILTAKQFKVSVASRGAEDYLTKPFGIEELLARIRVALRHSAQTLGSQKSQIITAGPVVIDLALHNVTHNGEEVKLTATEFTLLAYLAANAGRVLTNQSILSHVWDPADKDRVEYLRVYIRQDRLVRQN